MSHHHDDEFRLNSPEFNHLNKKLDRRRFLTKTSLGLGALAMGSLLGAEKIFGSSRNASPESAAKFEEDILKALPHIAPKAKRVVYLFMSGGPSQFETFDYKPKLVDLAGQNLPDSVRKGQRLTGMSANQSALPMVPSIYKFNQFGKSGTWVSELMPHTARVVDDLCIIKSINSEAINHDPAITFFQTGNQLPGRPSIGSWVSYGLVPTIRICRLLSCWFLKTDQRTSRCMRVCGAMVFCRQNIREYNSARERIRFYS